MLPGTKYLILSWVFGRFLYFYLICIIGNKIMFLFTCMLFWQVDWMSSIPICFSWVILTSWLNVLNSHLFFLMLFWQVDWMSSIHICFSWVILTSWLNVLNSHLFFLMLFWQVDWMSSIPICFSWVILTSWLNVLNFNYDYFMWLFKFVVGGWTRWWHHNTNPGYRV